MHICAYVCVYVCYTVCVLCSVCCMYMYMYVCGVGFVFACAVCVMNSLLNLILL